MDSPGLQSMVNASSGARYMYDMSQRFNFKILQEDHYFRSGEGPPFLQDSTSQQVESLSREPDCGESRYIKAWLCAEREGLEQVEPQ
jgi:hypothetical protein